MILIIAILAGLAAGLLISLWKRQPWRLPELHAIWLVFLAYLIQYFLFDLPATRTRVPTGLAAAGLVVSLILLLIFCWHNRRIAGVWLLATGLALNLLAIAANGGFMPISPATASQLIPAAVFKTLQAGRRFGYGKDILMLPQQTKLIWLSDCLLTPAWFWHPVAFSLGDLVIAAGAFWLMATRGKSWRAIKAERENE